MPSTIIHVEHIVSLVVLRADGYVVPTISATSITSSAVATSPQLEVESVTLASPSSDMTTASPVVLFLNTTSSSVPFSFTTVISELG